MVCLVVEKLHDTERFCLLDPDGTIPRIPDKHPLQVRVAQFGGPLFDFLVPLQTERLLNSAQSDGLVRKYRGFPLDARSLLIVPVSGRQPDKYRFDVAAIDWQKAIRSFQRSSLVSPSAAVINKAFSQVL